MQCPAESTSEQASTSLDECLCREGYYATWLGGNLTCAVCPSKTYWNFPHPGEVTAHGKLMPNPHAKMLPLR